jgi:hypothetical protein
MYQLLMVVVLAVMLEWAIRPNPRTVVRPAGSFLLCLLAFGVLKVVYVTGYVVLVDSEASPPLPDDLMSYTAAGSFFTWAVLLGLFRRFTVRKFRGQTQLEGAAPDA